MHKFLKATIIITIFAVLTRALGFLLRIFLSRVMGAEVLGAYQIAMSVFGVLMTIIASGLPLVVSRNVAYYEGKDESQQNRNITAGLIVAFVISLVICVLFFAFGGLLENILSAESVQMIYILLPSLFASSIYAILRGGLWGRKYFFTISFTEFFEQVIRLVLIWLLFALPLGLSSGQKSALSLTLSTVASCLLVLVLYFVFGGKLKRTNGEIKTVLKTSTPITMVRTVSSVIGSVIAIILPARLMLFGYSKSQALAIFGIYMGMTLPLLMVPSTFISSIAVALVPELSHHTNNIDKLEAGNRAELSSKIQNAIKSTIAISFVLMPAFLSLGIPVCKVLFENSEAGKFLVCSAAIMLPMGINQICSSILNAIGLETKELLHYAAGAMCLVLCVIFLPQFVGGYAMPIGFASMHLVSGVLSLITLKKRKLIDFGFAKSIGLCVLVCVPCVLLGVWTNSVLSKFMNLFFSTAISGALVVIFTVLLMVVFNVSSIKVLLVRFKRKREKMRKEKTTA